MIDTVDDQIDSGLHAAVRAFRAAAWVWMLVVTVLSFASIDRPLGAAAGVVAAGAVTAAWQTAGPRPAEVRRRLLAAEVLLGCAVVAADGWVFDDGRAHSYGSIWPLAGVLASAVHLGGRVGLGVGVLLGVARAAGEVLVVGGSWSATRALAVASTAVLFAMAGWAAGWASDRIRSAERLAARIEAREEVAAELHDGVLQTLAVIQRRSGDQDLVRLARSQEAELRRYLAGPEETASGASDALVLLRALAADATTRFGLRVEVAAVPPLPELGGEVSAALRGAIGESLANVAKHAGVDRAVIFAESDAEGLHVSVTDHGCGFDPDRTARRGLDHSVRERVERAGGTTAVTSGPEMGTTVTVHLPRVPA
jgi:signal transduction histidine kinase